MGYYNVAPRYTGGSPAMVTGPTAAMVAADEREAHRRALTGVYGDAERDRAERDGLRGISEYVREVAGCWLVHDLITDEHYVRPFPVYGETPLREGTRLARLRTRHGLPLQRDLERETVPR